MKLTIGQMKAVVRLLEKKATLGPLTAEEALALQKLTAMSENAVDGRNRRDRAEKGYDT